MKIMQLGKYYFPFRGGIETVVQNLSEGLKDSGLDIKVLCSNEMRKGERKSGLQIEVIKSARYGVLFSQPISPGLFFLMREYAKWADVMHFHTPNPMLEFLSLFVEKQGPWVATYHADVLNKKMLMPFYRPILRAFLSRLDRIIVPTINHILFSPHLREFQHKCQIIPFGVEPRDFLLTQEISQQQNKWKQQFQDFFLFVGRLVPYKGLEVAMHALAQVPDAKLVLVGNGPMRESLESSIRSLGIEKRVHFLGHVNETELKGLLHACRGLILPSITSAENFGLVQLEAMACSKPVITTNLRSGVPLVGEHQKTCFIVEPGRPSALAEAIHQLQQAPQLANEMGLAGLNRVQNHFTMKMMIDGHMNLYRELLSATEDVPLSLPKVA
jgi:glycosyltransferase involved in cell wall biosynthesis